MRNLVKTAAAVAVAMAISTAANADTQQAGVDSSVINSILPNNVQNIVNINAQITTEKNTQIKLNKHIQEQQKIVDDLSKKIKDAKTVDERHSDMEGQVDIQQKTVNTLRQQSSEIGKDLKEVQKLVDKYNSANALDLKKIYYTKKIDEIANKHGVYANVKTSFDTIISGLNNKIAEHHKLYSEESQQLANLKNKLNELTEEQINVKKVNEAQNNINSDNVKVSKTDENIKKFTKEIDQAIENTRLVSHEEFDKLVGSNSTKASKEELKHIASTKASKKAVHALIETETQIRAEKDATLDAKITSNVNQIKDNADWIAKVEGKTDVNRTKIKDNADWVAKVEGKADVNRTKIKDNADWIGKVESKADVNRTKISRLDTAFTNEVNTRISADKELSRDIKGNRALISTEADIRAAYDKALDRKISGTQAVLSQEADIRRKADKVLVGKITNNTQRLEIQSKRITRNAEAIADTQGKASELYEAVMLDNPDLQKAVKNLVTEKAKLDQLQKAKAAQDKGHATLAATKPVTDKDVKDQQKRVMAAKDVMHNVAPASRGELIALANTANNVGRAMQVQINSNKAAIAHNAQAIENNARHIHNLDKREQRHMAQNAALAGLFQPYSIGRVNVTAAMGQYRSNNAIAVGAGYRFDNNLAVKAGFSMSTNGADDAAYNVGVNYEF